MNAPPAPDGPPRPPRLRRRTADARDCAGDLSDAAALVAAMRAGCAAAGADVRREAVEPFVPHGVTCVLILAESHYTVSTWPEHRFVAIDACVCDPELLLDALLAPVLELIDPGGCDVRTI